MAGVQGLEPWARGFGGNRDISSLPNISAQVGHSFNPPPQSSRPLMLF